MRYRRCTFYVMSGTGNSFRAATWLAEEAETRGIAAEVIPIGKGQPRAQPPAGEEHLIGMFMPAHGFTAPWLIIRYAVLMPQSNGAHAFCISSRGGVRIGSVPLPGMEGTTCYLIALILALKGYRIRGTLGLDMPVSWLALHWGMNQQHVEDILERGKRGALRFVREILSGKTYFGFGGLACLFLGLLLLPISLLYLLMGRFYLAKLFFANNRCNGCGICAENCPADAIRMWGKKKRRPFWTFSCESCMRCMAYCPKQTIEAGHSWAVLLYYASSIPAGVVVARLSPIYPWLKHLDSYWLQVIVLYPYFIFSIAILYLGFASLVRIPVVNFLFTCTTFTHIYRRYHEPETRLEDLKAMPSCGLSDLRDV